MAGGLTDQQHLWLHQYTGLDPTGGKGLALSPEFLATAMKMGMDDRLAGKLPSAQFKPGSGPVADAYWQGYGGLSSGAGSGPAAPDPAEDAAFQRGLSDGIKHRSSAAETMPDGKVKDAYVKGYDAGWPKLLRVSPDVVNGPGGGAGPGPSGGEAGGKSRGKEGGKEGGDEDSPVPDYNVQLSYTFIPKTTHTTADGAQSEDQPGHQVAAQFTVVLHPKDQAGAEISAVGQATWFADEAGGQLKAQSGFVGAQFAWVWPFLNHAVTAGPMLQALIGASRATDAVSGKLAWRATGQVGVGGQVQYELPGFKGHLLIGVQAGLSGTTAKGAKGTVDQTAGLVITYQF